MKKYTYIDNSSRKQRRLLKRCLNKQGSVLVEAAVFLPVFLIAMFTMALLIRQVGIDETVFHSMLNQSRLMSVVNYSRELAGELGDIGFSGEELEKKTALLSGYAGFWRKGMYLAGLQSQLENELALPPDTVSLHYFHPDYKDLDRDHLCAAIAQYRTAVPLPHAFQKEILSRQKLVSRAFVGKTADAEHTTAQEMETEKESCIVYIFPHSGKRYHSQQCSIVSAQPVLITLNNSIKRNFNPCERCRAESISNGSGVYCFQSYGGVYHRGSCKTVAKYILKTEKDEAVRQGYTPCQKCGGGE